MSFLTPTRHFFLHSVDPFTKKEWYDVKAPSMFPKRQVGKTIATKSQGMFSSAITQRRLHFNHLLGLKLSRDSLVGRVLEVSLGDLKEKVLIGHHSLC